MSKTRFRFNQTPQLNELIVTAQFASKWPQKKLPVLTDKPMPSSTPDVFVSYARANNHDQWVTGFVERFKNSLTEKLSKDEAEIYFDDETVERNVEYDTAIDEAVKNSKLLLVIASKKYLTRPWCDRERSTFLKHNHKSRIVIIRYDDVPLAHLHDVLPKHIGVEFCNSNGLCFKHESDEFSWAMHDLTQDVASKLLDGTYAGPLVVPANPTSEKKEISTEQINRLIGILRQQQDRQLILTATIIANSILRGSIISDRPHSDRDHPISSIVHGLVRDMIAHDFEEPNPAIIRFTVLLHQLLPTEQQARSEVRGWFDTVCKPAGYEFHAVLGSLPEFPEESQRYFWLDVFWDDPIPGEAASSALAYLRCGHLCYPILREMNAIEKHLQLAKAVKSPSIPSRDILPLNHVSVAVCFEELNKTWERQVTDNQEEIEFLTAPITLRLSNNTATRVCQMSIEDSHIAPFGDPDEFSIHVQDNGVFATGKLDGTDDSPCEIIKAILNHATIGLWTRGVPESDSNESNIQKVLLNQRIDQVPHVIHQRRTGAVSPDSLWRRTVLFFDPNIKPLSANATDDIFAINTQLD